MKHMIWMLHDFVHAFTVFMSTYFFPTSVALVLSVFGGVSFLRRSRKPFLITMSVLAVMYGAYWLCNWASLDWKLYVFAMRHA